MTPQGAMKIQAPFKAFQKEHHQRNMWESTQAKTCIPMDLSVMYIMFGNVTVCGDACRGLSSRKHND